MRKHKVTDHVAATIATYDRIAPHYIVTGEEGPDHDKTFEVVISIAGKTYGMGRGRSKKEAEQQAAEEALRSLQEN